ncbi:hypothetical protein G6F63_015149 [Rhizopus arrhizus]|nr:hypothetical protein G6F63_015149 [Rhizopus arrhizus]
MRRFSIASTAAQPLQHQPGDGHVVGAARQRDTGQALQVIQGQRTVGLPLAFALRDHAIAFVLGIHQVAGNRGQQVVGRHPAFHAAVLVHCHRQWHRVLTDQLQRL